MQRMEKFKSQIKHTKVKAKMNKITSQIFPVSRTHFCVQQAIRKNVALAS